MIKKYLIVCTGTCTNVHSKNERSRVDKIYISILFVFILELAKNAALWFKNGNTEKKRRVLEALLSNCIFKMGILI